MLSTAPTQKNRRVALVTNIPRPYRTPLYSNLSRRLEESGGTFKVFFYSDPGKHVRRRGLQVGTVTQGENDSYQHEYVPGLDVKIGYERVVSLPLPLLPALWRFRPDVVIAGTFGPAGYLCWLYTFGKRVPFVLWSGATMNSQRQIGRIAALTQKFLARLSTTSLTYGTAARDYLISLGVRSSRIVVGVNAVDNVLFADLCAKAAAEAAKLKETHNWSGVNLVYVGNLVSLKGIHYVLEALAKLEPAAASYQLHLVGAGPAEAELRTHVIRLGIADRVQFWGAKLPGEVPLYYALADVLVFPSLYDVWGLVLNEAMSCGVPAVSSTLAGATADLIEHGMNGFAVDPRDVDQLSRVLKEIMADVQLRRRMSEAASATIRQKATIQHSADAFMRVIRLALQ